jgi:hypothetical protein
VKQLPRSCIILLLVWAAATALVGVTYYRRVPDETAIPVAFIGGVILWLGVLFAVGTVQRVREWRLIRDAFTGAPRGEGETVAVIGRLSATGSPEISPMTATQAVAYKYKITRPAGKNTQTLYEGFALAPSAIYSNNGIVKLFAFPDLKVKARVLKGAEIEGVMRDSIARTSFSRFGAHFTDIMEGLRRDLGNDQGRLHVDHSFTEDTDIRGALFSEWVVKPGDNVCVIGRYSAARQAIVPDPHEPLNLTSLTVGDESSFGRRALMSAFGSAFMSLILLGLVIAAYVYFVATVPGR